MLNHWQCNFFKVDRPDKKAFTGLPGAPGRSLPTHVVPKGNEDINPDCKICSLSLLCTMLLLFW